MKRVIKNKKKMKNTMYIVFGTFALLLFMITRANPSFANEGLIIDEALDKIAEQTVILDPLPEEDESETSNETLEEGENITEPRITPEEKAEEGDENFQDLEGDEDTDDSEFEKNLGGEEVDNGENNDNENEGGKSEENEETSEIEEVDNQTELQIPEISSDGEMHEGFQVPLLNKSENDTILEVMNNNEYVVTFNLNGGYWTEEGTGSTNEKSKTYEPGNQGILTNWRTPSKEDLCTDGEKTNMKCMFDGWYLEEEGITRWTGYVSKDMKVYARWLPFEDREVVFNDGSKIIIMDRNIGAITGNREDTGSYGYHFQWGNNYGFKLKGDNGESFPNGETIGESSVENSIPDNASTYYYSSWRSIRRSNYHSNIWGGYPSSNPDTLKQGPCPKGYHVPEIEEWRSLINLMGSNVGGSDINNILNLPSPGYTYSSTSINGLGTSAGYGVVTPAGLNQIYEMFIYKNGRYTYEYASTPIYGMSVRCFKDFPIKDIVFHCNGGTDINAVYQTAREKEAQELPITAQENKVFLGWYTTEDFNEDTKVLTTNIMTTDSKETVDLYAKWSCAFGYESEDNGETCIPYSVKFESNGGDFGNGDIYKINSEINNIENNVVRYSHTSNIDDLGNQDGNYGYYLNTVADVITITGAEKLNITIKHGTEGILWDWVSMWKGSHPDYTAEKDYSKSIIGNGGKLGGTENIITTNEYEVEGDSVTFSFRSDGSNSYYGYYATISGRERIPYVTYPENSFNNIPEPTKEGYSFDGWFFDDGIFQHEFNSSEVITGESMNVYAKWNANTYTVSFNSDNGEINPENMTVTYDSQYPELPVVTRTGYIFDGWYNGEEKINSGDVVQITGDVVLKAKRTINQYKIMFDTDGGNEINPIEKDYNSLLSGLNLPTPNKECNELSGWDVELPEAMPAHDITLKAIWNYTCSRSSGAGGRKTETTTREIAIDTNTENEHNSADEKENTETSEENKTTLSDETSNQVISVTQEVSEDGTVEAVIETVKIRNTDIIATVRTEVNSSNSSSSSSSSTTHTKEQKDAYSFAKSNGITTTKSIETAKMDTELTRIQMAKMVSNYAINVLGQEPDTSKGTVEFKDVTEEMDKQYDNAVTKAYQLGIMGQNVNDNKFRPNDEVSRAEFSATLSRLLYHTEEGKYRGTGKYYVPHIAKLYNEGIINKVNPIMKEKRGYVMTMLMRTVK